MQRYIITENLDDHLGYVIGTSVTKTGEEIDGLSCVTDGKTEWLVSEDEILPMSDSSSYPENLLMRY